MEMLNLSQQQMQLAANAGIQLLNTSGAVNVPGPLAVTDQIKHLNVMLNGIASGQVVVVNPKNVKKGEPEEEGGEKKAELKAVEGGKEEKSK